MLLAYTYATSCNPHDFTHVTFERLERTDGKIAVSGIVVAAALVALLFSSTVAGIVAAVVVGITFPKIALASSKAGYKHMLDARGISLNT